MPVPQTKPAAVGRRPRVSSADCSPRAAPQVIRASELEPNLKSFGFSVHGGLDMDGNQYSDLVIGAHDSSAAVYLR